MHPVDLPPRTVFDVCPFGCSPTSNMSERRCERRRVPTKAHSLAAGASLVLRGHLRQGPPDANRRLEPDSPGRPTPESNGAIVAGRRQVFAVRGERQRFHPVGVAFQHRKALPTGALLQPHHLIEAAGGERPAVRRESQDSIALSVRCLRPLHFEGVRRPSLHFSSHTATDESAPVGRNRDRVRARRTADRARFRTRGKVPEEHLSEASGCQPATVGATMSRPRAPSASHPNEFRFCRRSHPKSLPCTKCIRFALSFSSGSISTQARRSPPGCQ